MKNRLISEDDKEKSIQKNIDLMQRTPAEKVQKIANKIITVLWIALIVLCVINKDKITVDGVLKLTPASPVLAALFMIIIFGLKSICVVVYVGFLYALTGIMFPMYEAIAINLIGTVVMLTIPYVWGRYAGKSALQYVERKSPKVKRVQELSEINSFLFTLILRSNGVLPCDIMSIYLGAIGVPYPTYLVASVLGMLVLAVTFPIIGTNVLNIRSPQFLIALAINLVVMAGSVAAYAIILKKKRKEKENLSEEADYDKEVASLESKDENDKS